MVQAVRKTEKALGEVRYETTEKESESETFRRSLFVVEDVAEGETLTADDVRSIRPGDGLHPRHLENIIGHKAAKPIDRGTPLEYRLLSNPGTLVPGINHVMAESVDHILFLHLPKAAGTTLRNVVKRRFPSEATLQLTGAPCSCEQQIQSCSAADQKSLRFVTGHFVYGLHEHLPGRSSYVTLMRDPVERIISKYYYIYRSPHHDLHNWVRKGGMSLREFVEASLESPHRKQVSNLQAYRIAGNEVDDEASSYMLLEEAKQNIRSEFKVVGTIERFDASLLLMQEVFGWNEHVCYRRRNETGKRPGAADIDPNTVELIRNHNKADCSLYEWVNQRLSEALRAHVDEWDLRMFSVLNRLYSTYRGTRKGVRKMVRD